MFLSGRSRALRRHGRQGAAHSQRRVIMLRLDAPQSLSQQLAGLIREQIRSGRAAAWLATAFYHRPWLKAENNLVIACGASRQVGGVRGLGSWHVR
jgi:hypothetical protein